MCYYRQCKELFTVESTTLLLSLTTALKDAIGVAANKQNISSSELIRRAVANAIGYDLEAEKQEKKKNERRGRPRLYATSEERIAAARERTQTQRELTNKLLEHVRQQEHAGNIAALEESLKRRSINIK